MKINEKKGKIIIEISTFAAAMENLPRTMMITPP